MIWLGALFYQIPLQIRLAVYAVLVGGVVGGYFTWKHHIYTEGRTYERNRMLNEIQANQSAEIELKQKARADADAAVERDGATGMLNDPYNRDNRRPDAH